jgi:DNA processing protein
MDALRARAVLARAPGLSAEAARALLEVAAGDECAACARRTLRAVALPRPVREFLTAPDERAIEADLAWVEASGARIVLYTDPEYPPLLACTASPPASLYLIGSPAVLCSPQLAMVGSRSPTPAGRATARELAAAFARLGLTITSGLAHGIDGASHEGALQGGGLTLAVCATGLDRVYPPGHRALAERIRAHGALVSEFPPRTAPLGRHFPRRNRIIAGLALGTLVIEAAERSGSLITARRALDAGRGVFAVPGSIHSPVSRGCHQLIRDGATLVGQADDVMSELSISFRKEQLSGVPAAAPAEAALDKEYEMLLDALGFEPATIDSLVARTELPSESIASMLLILELDGRVATLPGGRYGRIPRQ